MKRFLVEKLPTPQNQTELSRKESDHARNVLRLREGSQIEAIDGKGSACIAVLTYKKGQAFLTWSEGQSTARASSELETLPIVLEAAVLKGSAYEWLVEKATELGTAQLAPVLSERTIVRVKDPSASNFLDRLHRIADQSLKQCGRLTRLEIAAPLPLEEALANPSDPQGKIRIWCDESQSQSGEAPTLYEYLSQLSSVPKEIRLLVGPEGGWSPSEASLIPKLSILPLQRVSLGPIVMRAETASLAGLSLVAGFFRSKLERI